MNKAIMKKSLQWDDLRYFLALYRHRKLVLAGKALNVDHTTVSRRVKELESVLNARLFDKKENGFEVTQSGQNLISYAENIENQLVFLEEKVSCEENDLNGSVRVGSPGSFGACFLASKFPSLLQKHTGLQIDLMDYSGSDEYKNGEIDIVVTTKRPAKGRFVVRRLTDYKMGLFASADYLKCHPVIKNKKDLAGHKVIGYIDKNILAEQMLPLDQKLLFKNCNVLAQYKILKEGHGLCFLPNFMVEDSDGIIQILPEDIALKSTLWLVLKEDVRHVSRIKKVADFIADTTYQYRADFA